MNLSKTASSNSSSDRIRRSSHFKILASTFDTSITELFLRNRLSVRQLSLLLLDLPCTRATMAYCDLVIWSFFIDVWIMSTTRFVIVRPCFAILDCKTRLCAMFTFAMVFSCFDFLDSTFAWAALERNISA